MKVRMGLVLAAATLVGVAACSTSTPASNDDLRRDLELARGQGLELAPRAAGQATVSAAELHPDNAKPVATRASRVRQNTPVVVASPKGESVAEAPQPAVEPTAAPAPAAASVEPTPAPAAAGPVRPQPTRGKPAMNPEPPGGYRTMGELIRKAPFPINP